MFTARHDRVRDGSGMAGFLLGAIGMFATMYATQALLPELGRAFDVSPAQSGLTISVVVLALAAGAWLWGPISDHWGRRRSIVLASALLVPPTIAVGAAPTFGVLLAMRVLQGLCMPGLLTVGLPYMSEVFVPRLGGRAMGYYTASLVVGGLIGRVGVALAATEVGWRWALGGLAILPLAGALVMARTLPEVAPPSRSLTPIRRRARAQLRNRALLAVALAGAALFFAFVGIFSFVTYRLERAPFGLGTGAGSLIFVLWVTGAIGPPTGRLADRVGWRPLLLGALGLAAAGALISLPSLLVTVVIGLAIVTVAMFAGVTVAQLGVGAAASVDRGVASAVYYSIYYTAGALGGFVPGLTWQTWGWPGVALLAVCVLTLALVAQLLLGRERASERPPSRYACSTRPEQVR